MEVSFIALETRERLFDREWEREEFTFDDTLLRFRGNAYIAYIERKRIPLNSAQSVHTQDNALTATSHGLN